MKVPVSRTHQPIFQTPECGMRNGGDGSSRAMVQAEQPVLARSFFMLPDE